MDLIEELVKQIPMAEKMLETKGVESVTCLSTDKVTYPINDMGTTKTIEEKVAVAKSRMSGKTKICVLVKVMLRVLVDLFSVLD